MSRSIVNPDQQSAVTWRAVIVGCLAAVVLGVMDPYSALWMQASRFGVGACASGAFVLFLFVIVFVQTALRAINPRWAFTRGELLTIFLMSVMAIAVTTRGFVAQFYPIITGPVYHAGVQGDWARTVVPHLPKWLFVVDAQYIREFYEGLPAGAEIPWRIWVAPTFWWLVLMAAFYVAALCFMSMLRRQWVEGESISYPIMRVAVDVIDADSKARRVNPFLKNPVFWVGFGLTFLVSGITALSRYFPHISPIPLSWNLVSESRCFWARLYIMPLMLAFGFLIPTRITFSLWFFWVVHIFERGFLKMLGFSLKEGGVQEQVVRVIGRLQAGNSGLMGDFDGKRSVGFTDFLMFAQAFGGTDSRFDLDGNGSVGFTDFLMFAGQFGKSAR